MAALEAQALQRIPYEAARFGSPQSGEEIARAVAMDEARRELAPWHERCAEADAVCVKWRDYLAAHPTLDPHGLLTTMQFGLADTMRALERERLALAERTLEAQRRRDEMARYMHEVVRTDREQQALRTDAWIHKHLVRTALASTSADTNHALLCGALQALHDNGYRPPFPGDADCKDECSMYHYASAQIASIRKRARDEALELCDEAPATQRPRSSSRHVPKQAMADLGSVLQMATDAARRWAT